LKKIWLIGFGFWRDFLPLILVMFGLLIIAGALYRSAVDTNRLFSLKHETYKFSHTKCGKILFTNALTIPIPSLIFREALNALRYNGMYSEDELALVAGSLCKYSFNVWDPKGKLYKQTAKLSLKQISPSVMQPI